MRAMIDDKIIFNEESFELEVKSAQRSVVQRSAAGLDGQVNIDLGLRGRKIAQKGILLGKNQNELGRQIDAINQIIDGGLHILKTPDGRIFENLLIEEFQTGQIVNGGAGANCQYTITYIQQVY